MDRAQRTLREQLERVSSQQVNDQGRSSRWTVLAAPIIPFGYRPDWEGGFGRRPAQRVHSDKMNLVFSSKRLSHLCGIDLVLESRHVLLSWSSAGIPARSSLGWRNGENSSISRQPAATFVCPLHSQGLERHLVAAIVYDGVCISGFGMVMRATEAPFPMETTYTWTEVAPRRTQHVAAQP